MHGQERHNILVEICYRIPFSLVLFAPMKPKGTRTLLHKLIVSYSKLNIIIKETSDLPNNIVVWSPIHVYIIYEGKDITFGLLKK